MVACDLGATALKLQLQPLPCKPPFPPPVAAACDELACRCWQQAAHSGRPWLRRQQVFHSKMLLPCCSRSRAAASAMRYGSSQVSRGAHVRHASLQLLLCKAGGAHGGVQRAWHLHREWGVDWNSWSGQIANKASAKLLLLPPAAAIVQGEGVHRGLQRARHLQRNGDE